MAPRRHLLPATADLLVEFREEAQLVRAANRRLKRDDNQIDRARVLEARNRWFARLTAGGSWIRTDPRLFKYSVILVNPARHRQVKADMGMAFIDWLTSSAGQAKIASYKVEGQQLFFPDYRKP